MQISHAFNDIHRVGMEQARDFIRSLVEEIGTASNEKEAEDWDKARDAYGGDREDV